MSDPLKEKKEFFALNGLRFAAAFWVLVFHCSFHFGEISFLGSLQPIIDQGTLAMTLFFMLSGFVLSYRYRGFATGDEFRAYTAARLARLYPVYAVMGLITLWMIPGVAGSFALYADHGFAGKVVFLAILCLLFLFALQAWFPAFFSANIWNFGGSWSLSVEAFFYALFPWLRNRLANLAVKKLALLLAGMVLTMAVITVGMLASQPRGQDASSVFYVVPIFRFPEFVLGIVGFVLFAEREVGIKQLYAFGLILGVLLVVCMYAWNLPGWIDYGWLAAIPFLAGFVLSTRIDAPVAIKVFVNYCGRISYCVYMAQFTTVPILKRFRAELSVEEVWILAMGSTLLLAILTYHFIEVLAYRRTRSLALYLQEKIGSCTSRCA
jgi:peptidoglycan/LPS O-acetylase OafA/YrhL